MIDVSFGFDFIVVDTFNVSLTDVLVSLVVFVSFNGSCLYTDCSIRTLWEYFDSCSTFFALPIFKEVLYTFVVGHCCCIQPRRSISYYSPLEINYHLRRCFISNILS